MFVFPPEKELYILMLEERINQRNLFEKIINKDRFLYGNPWINVYEGEEENKEVENKDEVVNVDEEVKNKQTFTQDDVNRFLAADRKKHQGQVEKTVKQLEVLQKSKTLTEKERSNLQLKIDELQNSLLTKEQLTVKEKEKLENQHKQTVQSLTTERDTWQNRFISSQINQAIVGEAVKAKAFDAEDLIARLGPNTRLVEDTDEESKPLNTFTPKVKFNDTDSEGKPLTLELTVEQAVKRMKEMPKFAHLFESTATGGVGANPGTKGVKVDIKNMTPEQYREYRKKQNMNRKVGQ